MVTLNTIYKHEYVGLSTDTKPIDAKNGDVFNAIDTNTRYIFDEENHIWREPGVSNNDSTDEG